MIAAIRIKGYVQTAYHVRDTMRMLRLDRVNHMVVIKDSPSNIGMLKKVEFLVTFGSIDAPTFAAVLEKRGRLEGDKRLTEEFLKAHKAKNFEEVAKWILEGKKSLKDLGIKPVFRLHPPRKGFERSGVKRAFTVGGAAGNRGEKINALVKAMS